MTELFLIEHPHRFATVASGLLGWRLSKRALDAFKYKYKQYSGLSHSG